MAAKLLKVQLQTIFRVWCMVFGPLLAIFLAHLKTGWTTGNTFRMLDGCVCPGYNVTFECTTVGRGITVWQGSAFDCPLSSNEIQLRHSQFTGSVGVCNDGDICAHAIGILSPDCFVSHLSVKVTMALEGRTVLCEHDDGDAVNTVNSTVLTITRDSIAGPLNLVLVDAGPGVLNFSWTPVLPMCRALNYAIDSTNCGLCPNASNSTTAICRYFPVSVIRSVCRFAVKTVVCGNITGATSTESFVTLGVQDAPTIVNSTSVYSNDTLTRIALTLRLNSDEFNISESVDGSVTSIKINYNSDSNDDKICHSAVIPSSLCHNGVCHHDFDVTTSSCASNNITITSLSSNVFGDGPLSNAVFIDGNNRFVRVEAQIGKIICTFLKAELGEKSCIVNYGPSCQELNSEQLSGRINEADGNVVEVPLLHETEEYCYFVTAISSTVIVNVTGTFRKEAKGSIDILAVVVVVILVGAAVICTLIPILICILLQRNKKANARSTKLPNNGESVTIQLQSITKKEESEALLGPSFTEIFRFNTIHDDSKQELGGIIDEEPDYGITFQELQLLNPCAN